MTRPALSFVLTAMLLGTAACGTKGVSIESQEPESTVVRRRPNRITAAELADMRHLNAEEAVQRLRPRWLRSRSNQEDFRNPEDVLSVYVNLSFRGDKTELARVGVNQIEGMVFLNARQSFERFGPQHKSGAILITLRGGN